MADVHPSAIVSAGAILGAGVRVGPDVLIEDDVEVGERTVLAKGTILHAGTRLGADCRIGPYAVIGGLPMDTKFKGETSYAVLGDEVIVREFATIHRATGEGAATSVGRATLLMCYAHVTHNVRVGAGCVLTNTVQLGGHAQIGDHAVLGNGAMVHQYTRVGAYAMVAAHSALNSDILPYALAQGAPARHFRINAVGLERHGFDADQRRILNTALRLLRQKRDRAFFELAESHPRVADIRSFIAASQRGVARFAGR